MTRYWIGVASHEHVKHGVKEGIAQVCHGKATPLKRMSPGDWLIYYSPVELFQSKESCKKFTALGKIAGEEPYQFKMTEDFIPWRRAVVYKKINPVEIVPLIDKLNFIINKQRWGFPFRRGLFEIDKKDFLLITKKMDIKIHG